MEEKKVVNNDPQITELISALIEAEKEFKKIVPDKDNPFGEYKYASFGQIIEATKPALLKNNLVIVQYVENDHSDVVVETTLFHASGQSLWTCISHPPVENKKSNPAQAFGAAASYLRKYAYMGILGLAPEDDDAQDLLARALTKEERQPYMDRATEAAEVLPDNIKKSFKARLAHNLTAPEIEQIVKEMEDEAEKIVKKRWDDVKVQEVSSLEGQQELDDIY